MNHLTEPATVIVGAGFSGLFAALHLRSQNYIQPIILIDPQERFVFKPILYDWLSGELPEDIVCPPYQELLTGSNINFVQDKVVKIDLEQNRVDLASGSDYMYDYLLLAVGSNQSYLHTEGAAENAFAFRTREDTIKLERQLRSCLLRAINIQDQIQRQSLLTFAIVGAGPAGIELAGTLADLLPYWYGKLGGDVGDIQIWLINHSKSILNGDANENLRHIVRESLAKRTVPVDLLVDVEVKVVDSQHLEYQPNNTQETKSITTYTTIWTAGVAVNPLIQNLKSQIPEKNWHEHGLPIVLPTLQLPDFPHVFAAGDCAVVQNNPQPALAQVAYQQGVAIAQNLIALTQGKSPKPAEVKLRGTLMKLGIGDAVADLFNRVQIKGKTGDLIRHATYLELLPTPLHNFKTTLEWLNEETFHNYLRSKVVSTTRGRNFSPSQLRERTIVTGLAIIAPSLFLIATYLGLKTPMSELSKRSHESGVRSQEKNQDAASFFKSSNITRRTECIGYQSIIGVYPIQIQSIRLLSIL